MNGIRIRNGSGQLQITSEYQNVAFIRKTTISGNPTATIDVSAGQTVAVRPSKPSVIWVTSAGNGNVRWNIMSGWAQKNDRSVSVDCYVFGPPPELGSGGAGVRIRRQDGTVAFDSRLKYLNVYDVVNQKNAATYAPSGRTMAVICNSYAFFQWMMFDPGSEPGMSDNGKVTYYVTSEYTAINSSGSGISFVPQTATKGFRDVHEPLSYPDTFSRDGSSVMVVDVTGF